VDVVTHVERKRLERIMADLLWLYEQDRTLADSEMEAISTIRTHVDHRLDDAGWV
jgi:hypothetical protein